MDRGLGVDGLAAAHLCKPHMLLFCVTVAPSDWSAAAGCDDVWNPIPPFQVKAMFPRGPDQELHLLPCMSYDGQVMSISATLMLPCCHITVIPLT